MELPLQAAVKKPLDHLLYNLEMRVNDDNMV